EPEGMLENCVQFIQAKEHREITVRFMPGGMGTVSVLADPDRLEQIVLNLLDNAVKHSPPGTPIDVLVERDSSCAAFRIVHACDPITEEQRRALDPLCGNFKRREDSLVRDTRGSGLGLFITRELVTVRGGTIRLFYEDGRFTVRFSIPLYRDAAIPV